MKLKRIENKIFHNTLVLIDMLKGVFKSYVSNSPNAFETGNIVNDLTQETFIAGFVKLISKLHELEK